MSEQPDPSPPRVPEPPPRDDRWERELLARVVFAAVNEQRRARRWNIAFRFAILVYLVVLLVMFAPQSWLPTISSRHSALVDVTGLIAEQTVASADRVVTGLRAAFEDENTAGVIIRINSPGGSPVQAGYINDEVQRLRAAYPKVPVYAVIADVCASGGYYIAAAADRIYADKASIVGSIGVLMNGFGFVETMQKLGVERRLVTAGRNKGLLDPFSPVREEELSHVRSMLDNIHEQFIAVVKAGRGSRLADDSRLFTGLVWTGEQSVELGLVDALGSAGYVAREVIGVEEIVDFTPRRPLLDRLSSEMGAAIGDAIASRVGIGGVPGLR